MAHVSLKLIHDLQDDNPLQSYLNFLKSIFSEITLNFIWRVFPHSDDEYNHRHQT